jgi:hypothetical protein
MFSSLSSSLKWREACSSAIVAPISEKLGVISWNSTWDAEIGIDHFCDGYEIRRGKLFIKRVGGIHDDYKCHECGYELDGKEVFIVKTLMFNNEVFLWNTTEGDYND